MKNRNIRKTIPTLLIALVLGCFAPSLTVQPADAKDNNNRSIVGMWRVHYSGDFVFESFDQWHSDGLEYEVANGFGMSCQGVFRQNGNTVTLFHTGWIYDSSGALVGHFNETQTNVVAQGGNTYSGTWHEKDYDINGNLLSEESGTLTATRLTVNTPP